MPHIIYFVLALLLGAILLFMAISFAIGEVERNLVSLRLLACPRANVEVRAVVVKTLLVVSNNSGDLRQGASGAAGRRRDLSRLDISKRGALLLFAGLLISPACIPSPDQHFAEHAALSSGIINIPLCHDIRLFRHNTSST